MTSFYQDRLGTNRENSKENRFLAGLGFLPLITVGQYFLIQFYIRNSRRQHNQREIAVASVRKTVCLF
jgi:hypothetical protein